MTITTDMVPLFEAAVRCDRCVRQQDCKVQRDDHGNLPQPGFVGQRYERSQVLLVGANPGVGSVTSAASEEERAYARLLGRLRDVGGGGSVEQLGGHIRRYMPSWSLYKQYIGPLLDECRLDLDDVAYVNAVRCRTLADGRPSRSMVSTCTSTHLASWLTALQPAVVVFVGVHASEMAGSTVAARRIPSAVLNRARDLSGAERAADRRAVAAVVGRYRA